MKHLLYYDGLIVGIITDPDNYPGGISDLCHRLSGDRDLMLAIDIPDEEEQLTTTSLDAKRG